MNRSLRLFDVACLGLNAIIGSGIFLLPDDLYLEMGGLSPLAFLLCGAGLLPVALCYAEAAGRTDQTGGPYVYARDAFGPRTGFLVGWMCYANSIVSFAAVAAAAAAYLARVAPALAGPATARPAAATVILAFCALNYLGVRLGARVTDVFTVAKVVALAVLVAGAAPAMDATRLAAPAPHGLAGVGRATFIALFAVQGFEVAPVPAGETRAAPRVMPVAILVSLAFAALLYVIVQTVVVGAHGGLGTPTDTPLVDAALAVAPSLAVVVTLGGLVSTLGFVSGNALGTPRYAFAAAQDGYLPRALARVHPRFGSPHVAIAATGALAALFALSADYRLLLGMSNVTVAVQYLSTCVAVVALRRRRGPSAGFRAPAGLLAPLLGAAVSLWIFTEGTRDELTYAAVALAIGALIAGLSRRVSTERPSG